MAVSHNTKAKHITRMFEYMLSSKDIYISKKRFTEVVNEKLNFFEYTINQYNLTKNVKQALLRSIYNLRQHILNVTVSK